MRIAISIGMAIFLPLAALMLVLSEPVCHALAESAISQGGAASDEQEYLVETAMAVRDFSLGNDNAGLPEGTDYRTAMTPDILSHLLDVRVVFVACTYASIVLFITLVFLIIVATKHRGAQALARPLIVGGVVPLAAAIVLGGAIAIDFSAFFTWMHGIFFADGSWTFPADSLLIRSLPYAFWMSCAVVWAACMVVFCIASIVVGAVLLRRKPKKSDDPESYKLEHS